MIEELAAIHGKRKRLNDPVPELLNVVLLTRQSENAPDIIGAGGYYHESGNPAHGVTQTQYQATITIQTLSQIWPIPQAKRELTHSLILQVARHEIEHAHQTLDVHRNAKDNHPKFNDLMYWVKYLQRPAELEAFVVSMYLTAKKDHTNFNHEFNDLVVTVNQAVPNPLHEVIQALEPIRWKMLAILDERFPKARFHDAQ